MILHLLSHYLYFLFLYKQYFSKSKLFSVESINSSMIKINLFINDKPKLDLYIAVICILPKSPRVMSLLKSWGYEFSKLQGITFKIFTPYEESDEQLFPSKYKVYVKTKFLGLLYRYAFYTSYASAHDYYENTTHKWYFRTTYDTFTHIGNLRKFIQKLNSKYNPDKDIVIKADHNKKFLHGGPGWVMSRAAVKYYLELEKEITKEYEKEGCGDDVNIMHFINKTNLTFYDIHTQEFAGWPVYDNSYESLIMSKFNYSNITTYCRNDLHISRVNDIVNWHNGRKKDYVNTIGKRIINNAPNYIGIHFYPFGGGEFCRIRNNTFKNEQINF